MTKMTKPSIILIAYFLCGIILTISGSGGSEDFAALRAPSPYSYQQIFSANYTSTSCLNASMSSRVTLQPDPLHWEMDGFHDSDGRRVYFRGVNVAGNAKLPPFIPFEDPRWWDNLSYWGFNMVRLTVFWEAIEPEPGIYDRSYLEKVKEMADQASRRGIYVLIDMHQDLFSRSLGGDGAPAWALPSGIKVNRTFSGPLWFIAYILSGDERASFANFFQSSLLKGHYSKAYAEVAKSMKGNRYVLGYDLMNEPSGGNLPNDDGQFEKGYLKPFYLQVLSAIREVDPNAVGFVEPNVLDMYGSSLTAFNMSGMVYAPHLYKPLSQNLFLNPMDQNMNFKALLNRHEEMAEELGMPLFIGEFGAPWTTKPVSKRNELVNQALEAMETSFVDNAYWDYSVRDVNIWNGEDFSLIDEKGQYRGLEVNVRPYLRRLNGLPQNQSFDITSRTYSLSFSSNPGAVPAIIYVPEGIQYPGGFMVKASDGHAEYHPSISELWYYPGREGNHNIIIIPEEIRSN